MKPVEEAIQMQEEVAVKLSQVRSLEPDGAAHIHLWSERGGPEDWLWTRLALEGLSIDEGQGLLFEQCTVCDGWRVSIVAQDTHSIIKIYTKEILR